MFLTLIAGNATATLLIAALPHDNIPPYASVAAKVCHRFSGLMFCEKVVAIAPSAALISHCIAVGLFGSTCLLVFVFCESLALLGHTSCIALPRQKLLTHACRVLAGISTRKFSINSSSAPNTAP